MASEFSELRGLKIKAAANRATISRVLNHLPECLHRCDAAASATSPKSSLLIALSTFFALSPFPQKNFVLASTSKDRGFGDHRTKWCWPIANCFYLNVSWLKVIHFCTLRPGIDVKNVKCSKYQTHYFRYLCASTRQVFFAIKIAI